MQILILCLVILITSQSVSVSLLTFAPRIATDELKPEVSYRLPNNTYPILYDLSLETWVDEGRLDFNGSVIIRVRVQENDTNSITLHSRNLNISEWQLQIIISGQLLVAVPVGTPSFDSVTDFITFSLTDDEKLQRNGDYRLFIKFSGVLREEQNGFYRSSYTKSKDEEVWFANTIFQLAEARTAFTCYDEPSKKAQFNIKILHSPNYHSISNTEVIDISVIPNNPHVATTFRLTPPIMTCVVAFMISDFSTIQNNESSIMHNVYASSNKIDDMDFGLEAAVKTLAVFEEYLNVSYSLGKYDQVGLPNFSPEATENWGLVQYNEDYLVYNHELSRATQKFTVARLVSHELSHQFFGNLVSPTWWSYSWLIEGFAVLAEYEITEMAYPELRSNEMFPQRITQWIFNPDSLESSRPLTMYGESKVETMQLFDGLSFFKAGSIFRMTENFLTAPVWRNGLNRYLTSLQYNNADGDDLFSALQEAATEAQIDLPTTVKDILDTWTLQKGFPIVEVIREYDNSGTIYFTQQRFVSTTNTNNDELTWWIPISIATKSIRNFETTTADYWLSKGEAIVSYQPSLEISNDDWIVVNKQQTGYYRVNYDEENWLKIAEELMYGDLNKIHLLSRGQLVDDALDLGRCGRLGLDIVLPIISYLRKEVEYVVWGSADEGLMRLYRTFRGNDRTKYFSRFFNEITEFVYDELRASSNLNEMHHTKLARNLAIKWACMVGNDNCLTDTAAIMNKVIYQEETIEPDLRAVIYCNGMRNANSTKVTTLWNNFYSLETDRNLILDGLVCNENADNLKTFLTNLFVSMADDVQKRRTFNGVFAASAQGLSSALEYFRENVFQIETVYKTSIGTLLINLATQINTIGEQEKFNNVITSLESIDPAIISNAQVIIKNNLDYVVENIGNIDSYLASKYNGSAKSLVISYCVITISIASLVTQRL